jgi:hypothetical protein
VQSNDRWDDYEAAARVVVEEFLVGMMGFRRFVYD